MRHAILAGAALLALLLAAGCPGGQGEAESADVHAEHDESHGGETAEEHAAHSEAAHAGESAEEHAAHAELEGEESHADEADEDSHAGHDHAELVSLTPEQIKEYGVEIGTAAGGPLELTLTFPGEVAINEDRVGHVLPKLAGVVQRVTKNIGDTVSRGDLMVVIDSRELAEAKADYLAAQERLKVALTNADREKQLFEKGVSPEQDYINANNAVREEEIRVRAAEQVLHALGLSEKQLANLDAEHDESLTRYEIYAPIGGSILEKHVSLGEMVSADSEMFLIADLSSVWVNLNVSQKDLPRISEGQKVVVRFDPATGGAADEDPSNTGLPDAHGSIDYIDALMSEETRTARVRIVLDNPGGQWRPGMFVTGIVAVDSTKSNVLIPLESVIKFEGAQTVFIADEHGFEPRVVELGRQSATHIEVLSGLSPGERYVTKGAYLVKAELGKSEAGHGH